MVEKKDDYENNIIQEADRKNKTASPMCGRTGHDGATGSDPDVKLGGSYFNDFDESGRTIQSKTISSSEGHREDGGVQADTGSSKKFENTISVRDPLITRLMKKPINIKSFRSNKKTYNDFNNLSL